MKRVFTYILFIISVMANLVLAQNITFKSEASSEQVRVGEQFKVGFYLLSDSRSISVDSPIDFPNFRGFQVLGENNVRNFQVVNGEMHSSSGVELVMVAEKEGNFKIGAAKVVIDGKTYTTRPIEISVSERSQTASNNRTQGVFLTSEVSNKNPFVNEAINLSVKLYARDYNLLNRARNFKAANFSGIDAKVIKNEDAAERLKQEMVNGRVYISEEIVNYLMFPQDAGKLKIDPFTVDVIVSGYYGAEPVTIASNPIHLNVKKLPAGKPKNFSGAVGDFKMSTNIDKSSLKHNEATNIEVEIYGTGNLNNIPLPKLKGNENLEIYAPKKRENLEISPAGFKGKLAETSTVVPQYGGEYKLEPIEFSYFNPNTEQYVTLKSDPIELKVDGEAAPEVVDSTAKVGEVNDYLSNQGTETILPAITEKLPEKVKENFFSVGILGLIGIALVGIFGFLIFRKKKNKTIDNKVAEVSKTKEKPKVKSKFVAKEQLNELKMLIHSDEKSFYETQEKLLIAVGMHHSNLDLANFTDFKAAEIMKNQGIKDEVVSQWQNLLHMARQAKYAPQMADHDLNKIYLETQEVIKNLN